MEHKNVEEDDELKPQKFGYNNKKNPSFQSIIQETLTISRNCENNIFQLYAMGD